MDLSFFSSCLSLWHRCCLDKHNHSGTVFAWLAAHLNLCTCARENLSLAYAYALLGLASRLIGQVGPLEGGRIKDQQISKVLPCDTCVFCPCHSYQITVCA